MLRFSLKHKFAAVQKIIGIYRQHENQMQGNIKQNLINSANGIRNFIKKIFGNRDLGIIKEWERFLET